MSIVKEPLSGVVTAELQQENLKIQMIDRLITDDRVTFKSQQIDDPELTVEERRTIATDILSDSRKKFLCRFGNYLNLTDLTYFEREFPAEPDEDKFEIKYYIESIKRNQIHHNRDVRNRRYEAMVSLISNNDEYFTEKEMMRREPLLYEQLIGQYLTDMERRLRDDFNDSMEPFSRILLEGYDNRTMDDLRKQQMEGDRDEDSDGIDSVDPEDSNLYPTVPAAMRKRWGEFEDEQPDVPVQHQRYVTAAERELLKEEFFGIMQAKFLSGDDKEFDYSAIDDNEDYDNIDLRNQDAEDQYFETDSDDGDGNVRDCGRQSSDDELDVFMKDLNKNIS